jgi:hypothetical protein
MDNVIYISDCCGVEVEPNCGHGEDMIAICPDCHEWCGVEVDDSMESDYIPGHDDGEAC